MTPETTDRPDTRPGDTRPGADTQPTAPQRPQLMTQAEQQAYDHGYRAGFRDVRLEPTDAPAIAIQIQPNETANPPGKLADAEIHFLAGPLEGAKLIGFAVWERRTGGGRNVTFPARQYSVNGERRSFALLRPASLTSVQDKIRDLVLQAFSRWAQHNSPRSTFTADGQLTPQRPGYERPERYDYDRQAWIGSDGRYLSCQHPPAMQCSCYGRAHAGELADPPAQAQALAQAQAPAAALASTTTTEEALGRTIADAITQATTPAQAPAPTTPSTPATPTRAQDAQAPAKKARRF